jgi:hypothetical protein
MAREALGSEPVIRFYCETPRVSDANVIADRLHQSIRETDPLYRDLESLLGIRPLRVTVLPRGSFSSYAELKRRAGAPLATWKPARMNPSSEELLALTAAAPAYADAIAA